MPLLITTSRRPTRRVRSFCKELAKALPSTVYVNRGKMSLDEVLLESLGRGADYALIVNVRKGNPGRLDLYHAESRRRVLSAVCLGVKLAREMGASASRIDRGVVVVEGEGDLEVLGKALSEALRLPMVRGRGRDELVEEGFRSAIRLSPRRGYLGAINFVDLRTKAAKGPLIRIRRLLPVG